MRKRLYTPLQLSALPAPGPDDPCMPVPMIHNIVSTAQIESTKMPMDLQVLDKIYWLHVMYGNFMHVVKLVVRFIRAFHLCLVVKLVVSCLGA